MRSLFIIALALASLALRAQFTLPRMLQAQDAWFPIEFSMKDIDGDGDVDALTEGHESGEYFWFENDGTGQFINRHSVMTLSSGHLLGLCVADLDGDGDEDIVSSIQLPYDLFWCENLGSGVFAAPVSIVTDTLRFIFMEPADVNEDGVIDLVALAGHWQGGQWSEGLYWFSHIGGQFTLHGPITQGFEQARDMTVSDVDGDGHVDIMAFDVDSLGGPTIKLMGDGQGNFGMPEPLLPAPWHAAHAVAEDFDSDGDIDVFADVEVGDTVVMKLAYFSNAGGTLQQPVILDSLMHNLIYYWLEATDLDGDGDLDVIASTDTGPFFLQNEQGALAPPVIFKPLGFYYQRCEVADVDGDGQPDLCGIESESALCWFKNLGGGQYGELQPIGRGLALVVQPVMADVDMDGQSDLVVASRIDSRIAWFKKGAHKLFAPYRLIDPEATYVECMVVGDDDDDGDPDILAALDRPVRVVRYTNNGEGTFSAKQTLFEGDVEISSLHEADLNNDGMRDVVFTDGAEPSACYWAPRIAPGQYGPKQLIDTTNYWMHECLPARINGDSILDLVICSMNDSHIFWRQGLGGGSFGSRQTITQPFLYNPTDLKAVDLDGDSDLDILASSQVGARMTWFANDGNGGFDPGTLIDEHNWNIYQTAVADFDMDGDNDIAILYPEYYDSLAWFRNDGAGAFGQKIVLDASEYLRAFLTPLDIDGDGDQDLVYTNGFENNLKYKENLVLGGFTIHGTIYEDLNHNGVRDAGEAGMPLVKLACTPPMSTPLTEADGSYTFYLPQGNYAISVGNVPPFWGLSSSPLTYNFSLSSLNPAVDSVDFGYAPTLDTTIVDVNIEPIAGPCGDPTVQYLTLLNRGTTRPNGILKFRLDDNYQWQTSTPLRDSVVAGVRYWHFDTLGYMQQHSILCHVISPSPDSLDMLSGESDLDAVLIDSTGTATDTISTMLYSELGCGWDPNDKQVEPAGYGTMGAVPMSTQQLTYTIHFQNTGSGQAFNVILRDRLSDDLDPSTIEMLAWSHAPSSIVIEADGELAVRFDGIHLPDSGSNRLGSNGYIKFRVGIVAGTTPSTEIDNTAEIYFDNQTGVLTNVTVNTLTDCSTWMPVINEPVSGALEATEGDNYQWYMDGSPLPDDTARTLLVPYPGSFTVMVASHLGCSALSDPYQVIGTGTPGPGGAVIAVFPVPFTVQARVVMDRPLTNAHKIDLIDACGRVLRSWHGDGRKEMTIDRAGLASGLYLLRVSIADALVAACRVMVE